MPDVTKEPFTLAFAEDADLPYNDGMNPEASRRGYDPDAEVESGIIEVEAPPFFLQKPPATVIFFEDFRVERYRKIREVLESLPAPIPANDDIPEVGFGPLEGGFVRVKEAHIIKLLMKHRHTLDLKFIAYALMGRWDPEEYPALFKENALYNIWGVLCEECTPEEVSRMLKKYTKRRIYKPS